MRVLDPVGFTVGLKHSDGLGSSLMFFQLRFGQKRSHSMVVFSNFEPLVAIRLKGQKVNVLLVAALFEDDRCVPRAIVV